MPVMVDMQQKKVARQAELDRFLRNLHLRASQREKLVNDWWRLELAQSPQAIEKELEAQGPVVAVPPHE
jgi:hypothetical protein